MKYTLMTQLKNINNIVLLIEKDVLALFEVIVRLSVHVLIV